jgi:hypothetical protein
VGAPFELIDRFGCHFVGGDAIEDNLNAIFSNPVASNIPKWRTFKLLRWVQKNPDNV